MQTVEFVIERKMLPDLADPCSVVEANFHVSFWTSLAEVTCSGITQNGRSFKCSVVRSIKDSYFLLFNYLDSIKLWPKTNAKELKGIAEYDVLIFYKDKYFFKDEKIKQLFFESLNLNSLLLEASDLNNNWYIKK